jgi:hypothetical protein
VELPASFAISHTISHPFTDFIANAVSHPNTGAIAYHFTITILLTIAESLAYTQATNTWCSIHTGSNC